MTKGQQETTFDAASLSCHLDKVIEILTRTPSLVSSNGMHRFKCDLLSLERSETTEIHENTKPLVEGQDGSSVVSRLIAPRRAAEDDGDDDGDDDEEAPPPRHFPTVVNRVNMPGRDAEDASCLTLCDEAEFKETDAGIEALKEKADSLLAKNDIDNAILLYTRKIASCPSYRLYVLRAEAHILKENWEEAVSDASQALLLNQDSVKAYKIRMKAYLQLEDKEHALRDVRKAQQIDYDDAMKDVHNDLEDWFSKKNGKMKFPPTSIDEQLKDNMPSLQTLESMMKDPKVLEMAQNLMKNPEAMKSMMGSFANGFDSSF